MQKNMENYAWIYDVYYYGGCLFSEFGAGRGPGRPEATDILVKKDVSNSGSAKLREALANAEKGK